MLNSLIAYCFTYKIFSEINKMVKEKPKTIQIQLKQPPIPPPLPPVQTKVSHLDLQSRAKTIRVGKVRWPPAPNVNLTFEYELQKLAYLIYLIFFCGKY